MKVSATRVLIFPCVTILPCYEATQLLQIQNGDAEMHALHSTISIFRTLTAKQSLRFDREILTQNARGGELGTALSNAKYALFVVYKIFFWFNKVSVLYFHHYTAIVPTVAIGFLLISENIPRLPVQMTTVISS